MFNFARSFEKFDCSSVCQQENDDHSGEDGDNDDDGKDNDGYDDDNDDVDNDVDDDNDEVSCSSDNEQSDSSTDSKKSFVNRITVWLMYIQLSLRLCYCCRHSIDFVDCQTFIFGTQDGRDSHSLVHGSGKT